MWIKITEIFVLWVLLLLDIISHVSCHLPRYITIPTNKVEQYCLQSETCIHDTITVCGRMGDETRTFLDLCDLLEYACDTNQIYTHVDDMKDCPASPKPPSER